MATFNLKNQTHLLMFVCCFPVFARIKHFSLAEAPKYQINGRKKSIIHVMHLANAS